MNQSVEERSQHNFIVKNNHVQVSNGSQEHEVRKVTGAKSHGFGIKRRGGMRAPLRMIVLTLSSRVREKQVCTLVLHPAANGSLARK